MSLVLLQLLVIKYLTLFITFTVIGKHKNLSGALVKVGSAWLEMPCYFLTTLTEL